MTLALPLSIAKQEFDLPGGGRVTLFRGWVPSTERIDIFDRLRRCGVWEQREMTMFGRRVLQPRLTAWWGDPGASYVYSGIRNEPRPWPGWLLGIKLLVEEDTGARFNSCLGNLYRDGSDYVSMHADDEPELGPRPTIASLSLGAPRRFVLAHQRERLRKVMTLEDGDLLVMSGPLQRDWRHGVPKMAGAAARVNLTFRWVEAI